MKVFDFKNIINENELEICANEINKGNLVIFPTETVYGIGADATNSNAVDKIFIAKGRANDNPLIVHLDSTDKINLYAEEPNEIEKILIDTFMPGPFTLILKKKEIIPNNVSCNLSTVGIRIPTNNIARKLIAKCNKPIAAPSANISSRPSCTTINDIIDDFSNLANIVIDGGESSIGLESTVVQVIDNIPVVLRPGKITPEEIRDLIGIVKVDEHVYKPATGQVLSPGMKYKHYAPNTDSILIYNDNLETLVEIIKKYNEDNSIIIGPDILHNHFKNIISYGKYNDYDEIAHKIFSLLRKVDKLNYNKIIIIGVKKEGIGIAIMNRLIRSCSYNYIENI